ncbi:MAG: GGDEF domain-containing protein [Betaproteobacteria bacterium]|nr:GGDEF domain-containing protein [Betaproteobacteria bacterium]
MGEARIFQLAYSDALTGLPNRLLLVDRLEQAVAAAQRNKSLVGMLFFDFDGFKQVNARYGHHAGDLLLKGMSERLRSCVREIDTVSRLGGDEFVVVLPELKEGADAGAVARKITAAMSQPFRIENHDIGVTLTAGISIYPNDGESAEILIRNADTAMYFAKESGKNRFRFFNPALQPPH